MFCFFLALIISVNISVPVLNQVSRGFEQVCITFLNFMDLIPLFTDVWLSGVFPLTPCVTRAHSALYVMPQWTGRRKLHYTKTYHPKISPECFHLLFIFPEACLHRDVYIYVCIHMFVYLSAKHKVHLTWQTERDRERQRLVAPWRWEDQGGMLRNLQYLESWTSIKVNMREPSWLKCSPPNCPYIPFLSYLLITNTETTG